MNNIIKQFPCKCETCSRLKDARKPPQTFPVQKVSPQCSNRQFGELYAARMLHDQQKAQQFAESFTESDLYEYSDSNISTQQINK